MDKSQFLIILRKYLDGIASPREVDYVNAYYRAFEVEPDILEVLTDEEKNKLGDKGLKELIGIIHKDVSTREIKAIKGKFPVWLKVAAAIIILFGISIYFFLTKPEQAGLQQSGTLIAAGEMELLPGGNRATLTLSDGKTIDLNSVQEGQIAAQQTTTILKIDEGQLVYNTADKVSKETPQFNSITTPRGGQYSVILPDGTKVWLNAESTLRFPTFFTGKVRRVELSGEGYFEIIHREDNPFVVNTQAMEVVDLGTVFNISAYPNEDTQTITLLSGLANVQSRQNELTLEPGKEVINNGGLLSKRDANIEKSVAWKNGLFYFDAADIHLICRQIARWYDVEIEINGPPTLKKLTGKVPRNIGLSKFLQVMQFTDIHFKIEGRKLTVLP